MVERVGHQFERQEASSYLNLPPHLPSPLSCMPNMTVKMTLLSSLPFATTHILHGYTHTHEERECEIKEKVQSSSFPANILYYYVLYSTMYTRSSIAVVYVVLFTCVLLLH